MTGDSNPRSFDPLLAVLEFHRGFDLLVGERPGFPPDSVVALRLSLIREELDELETAVDERDVAEVSDALADLLYVIYGTAISFGIDIRPIFEEVHRSNMSKIGGGTREDGKILKPADWTPPEVRALLDGMRLADEEAPDRGTTS